MIKIYFYIFLKTNCFVFSEQEENLFFFGDFRYSDLNNIQRRKRFWKVTQESMKKYKKLNKYNQCKIRRQGAKIKNLNNLLEELLKQKKISLSQSFVLKVDNL